MFKIHTQIITECAFSAALGIWLILSSSLFVFIKPPVFGNNKTEAA
jgi:hypothetical protein